MHRARPLLVAACLAGLPGAALAYRDVELSYTALRVSAATRTNGFATDQINQVWVATDQGLPALEGDRLARFFPLNRISDGLLANAVQAVAFGPLEVGATGDEHFFLGFGAAAAGIQYGRILAATGLNPKPPKALLRGVEKEDRVFALASDHVRSLWAGTEGGLVEWKVGAAIAAPASGGGPYRSGDVVRTLVVAPWGAEASRDPAVVFFAAASGAPGHLYRVRHGDGVANVKQIGRTSFDGVAGLAFEPRAVASGTDAALWVASGRDLWRYAGADLRGDTPEAAAASPVRAPGDAINGLAVDPLTGTVWVATDQGAYFQEPAGTPPALVPADCTGLADPCRGWRRLEVTRSGEKVHRVFLDPLGNPWLGTDRGVRVRLLRLLTLSGRRFVGKDARGTVTLEDSFLGENGLAGEGVQIAVVKLVEDPASPGSFVEGATALTLDLVEEADTGRFSATFGFSAAPGIQGPLAANRDDAFRLVYRFTVGGAPLAVRGPEFSWSDEKPFEDDLWIGGGCFLKALGR